MLDLLITKGRLVTGQLIDVGIKDGKIVQVAESLATNQAREHLDLAGESYLSAGWIDGHVHCYEAMELYYDQPDELGIKKGVTTVIDAGSTGASNVGAFYQLAKAAKTNVFALLNISKWGIITQDELSDLSRIEPEAIKETLLTYPDFIVGLKARMSKTVVGANGIVPLELAKEIQKENGQLPLMVHIGSAPPKLVDILERLEKGDIVTHCFNGKENGILGTEEVISEFVWEAYHKGVIFDIGHGTDSFNFQVAEIARQEQLKAATISTDCYHSNRQNGPVYDLATTMEKLLEVGYSLNELIEKVTTKPAAAFQLTTKGRLEAGFDGDLTIFKLIEKEKELTDSNGNQRLTGTCIVPEKAIVGGQVYDVK